MKPEIDAILNSIGWMKAKQVNRSLIFQCWEPNSRGNMYFTDKPGAKSGNKSLQKLEKAYSELPDSLRAKLNDQMKTSEDWDDGISPILTFDRALLTLLHHAKLEKERFWSGKGKSKNVNAYDIANQMAEIYVLGLGEMPTGGESAYEQIGQESDPKQAGSRFSKAVKKMYKALDVTANFREPADNAIKNLQSDNFKRFSQLIKLRNLNDHSISLFK